MKRVIGSCSVLVALIVGCLFIWTQTAPASEAPADHASRHVMPPGGSMLPSVETAREGMNAKNEEAGFP